jgi:hypothetical protein
MVLAQTQRARPGCVNVTPTSIACCIKWLDFASTGRTGSNHSDSIHEITSVGPVINDSVFHSKEVSSFADAEVSARS